MPRPSSDVGVIVGRFQVHQLHEAHRSLIQSVTKLHPQTFIVLGASPVRVSQRNPLDIEARRQLFREQFPDITVLYLKDEPSDEAWSAALDRLLDDVLTPAQSATLYGGRDSFIARYSGAYKTEVLEPEVYASGTELRRTIRGKVRGTEDFRAGVIWASANGYPKVFPTVDVAVRGQIVGPSDGTALEHKWLLVKKPNETLWRFPGGFVQPNDLNYEAAARREVAEETGVSIDGLTYVGSHRVDDWRYRDEDDKIVTILYLATYVYGPVRPADDVSHAKWFATIEADNLVPEHRPLLDLLKGGSHV